MSQNHHALSRRDPNKLHAARQAGGRQGSTPVEHGGQLIPPGLQLPWMWRNQRKRRQQPHPAILRKRMTRRNGLKVAGKGSVDLELNSPF